MQAGSVVARVELGFFVRAKLETRVLWRLEQLLVEQLAAGGRGRRRSHHGLLVVLALIHHSYHNAPDDRHGDRHAHAPSDGRKRSRRLRHGSARCASVLLSTPAGGPNETKKTKVCRK